MSIAGINKLLLYRDFILVAGTPGAGKSTFCLQMVIDSMAARRPVIFVTSEQSPTRILELLRERGITEAIGLNFVDAFTETVGLKATSRSDTVYADCADLNNLSIAIAKLQEKIAQKDTLLVLDSLTSPYLFNGSEVIRFMRLFLSRFVAEGNSVIVLIDEGCGKAEDIVAMMSIVDGVIKIERSEDKQILNIVKHPRVRPTIIEVPIERKRIQLKSRTHFDPNLMRQFVRSLLVEEEVDTKSPSGILRNMPLFSGISPDDLSSLSREFTRHHYGKGENIFIKGDYGSTFHLINTGKVKLSITSESGGDTIIGYLKSGDFFGEMALLNEGTRSATATATEPTETLALERDDFLDFLRCNPEVAINMLSVLAERMRNVDSRLEKTGSLRTRGGYAC